MNIPFLKSRKPTEQRSEIVLIDNEEGTVRLAFGLQWSPIVTSGGLDTACAMARKKGATHMLYRARALQIGHGYINPKLNPKSTAKIYPAAQVAARQHGGDSVFALKTGDNEYWLAVIRAGKPTSIDKFFSADSDATLLAEAEKIVADSAEDDTRFTVYTNIDRNSFTSPQRSSVEELLLAAANPEDILPTLPKLKGLQVPKPVAYAMGAVLVLLLANEGLNWKAKRDLARQQALKLSPVDEPAEIAWGRAISAWELTQAAPDRSGFMAARESVNSVPVLWNGWMLGALSCTAAALQQPTEANKSASRMWTCSAEYNKSRVGATNAVMAKSVPKGWAVTFLPLTQMRATWKVDQAAKSIKLSEMLDMDTHLIQTAAALQELSPAIVNDLKIAFRPLEIKPPLKSDGTSYSTADAPVTAFSAPITISGPIRTIDALSAAPVDVEWTNLKVVVAPVAKGKAQASTLKQSAITAEISGVLYAKNK